MNVLDRKLLRDIRQTRGLLAAIVLIVAIGTGCMIGFQGVMNNLNQAKTDYYNKCLIADFWVDIKKAPLTSLSELENIPGLRSLRSRISTQVMVDLPHIKRPVSGLMLSLPDEQQTVINQALIVKGSYFNGPNPHQVLVGEAFAKARGLNVGDNLRLIVNGQLKTLQICGIAISAEFVYLIPPGSILADPKEYGLFYVRRSLARELMGMQGAYNNLVGTLTPEAAQNPEPILKQIKYKLSAYGVFSTTTLAKQTSNLSLSSELAGLGSMAFFMPAMFLSVAALILNVLMLRLAAQQRSTIGTLKALGYGNAAIFAHFIKIGLVVGGIGAILGSLLGYAISGGMTELYRGIFTFPSLNNHFYPALNLMSLGISLFFGVLGSARGVMHIAGLNPAEAMRPPAPKQGDSILLEKIPWLWSRLSLNLQLCLRNVFRNKMRSIVGIFAAVIGTSMLVCTLGMLDSLRYMVDFQFKKAMLADYTLSFRKEVDYGAFYESARMPGVSRVEPILAVQGNFFNANLTHKGSIMGLTPKAKLTVPCTQKGEAVEVPQTGLLMNYRLAKHLGLKIGDYVNFTPSKGEQKTVRIRIGNMFTSMFGLQVYADFEYLNSLIGESSSLNMVRIRSDHNPRLKMKFTENLKRYPVLAGFSDKEAQQANMEYMFFDKMGGVAYPLILFGAIIFFGSILNSSLISIIERQREIATYRVLGYSNIEIGNMFLRESLVVNCMGILLGLPLGWEMLRGMAVMYTTDMYMMPCIVSSQSWGKSILMALAFVFICHLIVQRQIIRLDWNQALKLKE